MKKEKIINEKDMLSQKQHERKKELIILNRDVFEKKQKLIQNNIAFLWNLKFKFMKEQQILQIQKMEKAYELKKSK